MKPTPKTGIAAKVRAVFEASNKEVLKVADICVQLGIAESEDRKRVAWAVRDLVLTGYVEMTGRRRQCSYTWNGGTKKVRVKPSREEQLDRSREASRRYRRRNSTRTREEYLASFRTENPASRERRDVAPKPRASVARPAKQQPRLARVGLLAGNLPAPPVTPPVARAETVEEFLKRGGRVERLSTHWEQAA